VPSYSNGTLLLVFRKEGLQIYLWTATATATVISSIKSSLKRPFLQEQKGGKKILKDL
jgi:hypothetical protein